MAAENVEDSGRVDVLRYYDPDTGEKDTYRLVPTGRAEGIRAAHVTEVQKRRRVRWIALGAVVVIALGYGFVTDNILLGTVGAGAGLVLWWYTDPLDPDVVVPDVVEEGIDEERARWRYDLEA